METSSTSLAAIAAVALNGGIRSFIKATQEKIQEIRCDCSIATQQEALTSSNRNILQPQRDEWKSGSLSFECLKESHLCAIASPADVSHPDVALFYQEKDNSIQERRCGQQSKWDKTNFNQQDCLPGTCIAGLSSKKTHRMAVFFQDKDLHLCFRLGHQGQWDKVINRLDIAATGSGIAATSWNDAQTIHVFWQDQSYTIREYVIDFEQETIQLGGFAVRSTEVRRAMTAVSWGRQESHELRLFYVIPQDIIVEMRYSANEWRRANFRCDNVGKNPQQIVAFVRTNDNLDKACVNLMWISQDLVVRQRTRISSTHTRGSKWNDVSIVYRKPSSSGTNALLNPIDGILEAMRKLQEMLRAQSPEEARKVESDAGVVTSREQVENSV